MSAVKKTKGDSSPIQPKSPTGTPSPSPTPTAVGKPVTSSASPLAKPVEHLRTR
jgi:hypothetical protein